MRIAIMGSGGLGGYFGARLCAGGADVHFIARGAASGGHAPASGLRHRRRANPLLLPRVHATDDAAEIGAVDLVMFCVKLWDTEAALEQIRPLVGAADGDRLVPERRARSAICLKAAFDGSHVMGGVGYVATTIARPGVIRQHRALAATDLRRIRRFGFASAEHFWRPPGRRDRCRAVHGHPARDLAEVRLPGRTVLHHDDSMRKPDRPDPLEPQTRAFLLDVMREVVAVGRALGVNWPRTMPRCGCRSPTASPTHDLVDAPRSGARQSAGVRWLSGAVVELGLGKDIPTPLNRAIADILALHAAGKAR